LAAGLAFCRPAQAAQQQQNGRDAPGTPREEIDLFAGIAQQQLEVRLIPRDDLQCRLLITNKTDKPLSVKLPAAFAGVPVLAQFAPGNGFGNGFGNGPGMRQPGSNASPSPAAQNAPQRVGGGSGISALSVPPESMRQVKIETVCLDHGNPVPRPAIPYEIRPMSGATDKPLLAEVCELLGRHEIGHRAAQLAAWHLSNGMSWPSLAALRTPQAIGSIAAYTSEEIAAAKKAVAKAEQLHKQRQSADAQRSTWTASSAKQ
jgi:hypothetical protein